MATPFEDLTVLGGLRGLSARGRSANAGCADQLRHALQRDNGQMLSAALIGDIKFQLHAGPAADEGPRSGTGRSSWPLGTWLVAWPADGRKPAMIDLVGGHTAKRGVWPRLVVPVDHERKFAAESVMA